VVPDTSGNDLLQSCTAIVVAQLTTTPTIAAEVPALIRSVYDTLCDLNCSGHASASDPGAADAATAAVQVPAVPVEQSVTQDYLVCLEDGKQLRMLKRYLMTHFGMTPDDYREKWGLPADYPMAAPSVSEQRRSAALTGRFGKTARRRPAKSK
jgi:predicted transcriptional regulator